MTQCTAEGEPNEQHNPKVTVLMSVYNGEQYLREAIESILNQTYRDFEFLIINDASTDSSRDIIISYDDNRIRLVDNDINLGLTKSLNKGILLARGEYIARMDSDDVSLPVRLEVQVNYMNEHPASGICGSWVNIIGSMQDTWKYPQNHCEIACGLLFYNCLAHSSVIIRRAIIEKHNLYYDEDFKRSQDYELWSRAINYTRVVNIPTSLVNYRISENQIGQIFNSEQVGFANKVRESNLKRLGFVITDKLINAHNILCNRLCSNDSTRVTLVKEWVGLLQRKAKAFEDSRCYNKILFNMWFSFCIDTATPKWTALGAFLTGGVYCSNFFTFCKRVFRLIVR